MQAVPRGGLGFGRRGNIAISPLQHQYHTPPDGMSSELLRPCSTIGCSTLEFGLEVWYSEAEQTWAHQTLAKEGGLTGATALCATPRGGEARGTEATLVPGTLRRFGKCTRRPV